MPRYIDADALLNKVERYFWGLPIVVHHDMVEFIENAPTADVVEIVHCKDCSWCQLKRIRSNKFDSYFECILWGNPTTSEFYCAAGERRE